MGNQEQKPEKQPKQSKQKKRPSQAQRTFFTQQKLPQQPEINQIVFHVENIVFPLKTNKKNIIDYDGRKVKFAGANWSGTHMCRHCVDGLECRNIKDIEYDIRFKFKMNCVRLTYSLEMLFDDKTIPGKYLTANSDLIGKTSLQIFDITINTLTSMGLMVILNNHTSTSQWCCSNDDGDGLWWSRRYPQYIYFQHIEDLSKRYKENQRVIGIDLRNEIRKAHGNQPTWGSGVARTDWKRAAEKAGDIALKNAPNWLIFVGGINYQLDLTGVREKPITLSVPNRVVYTGHFYGFSWMLPTWNGFSYENFRKRMYNSQLYVRSLGHPYILGEFGTSVQDVPWKYLMRYLKQADIDWIYWSIDGFKCEVQKDQPLGLFAKNFKDIRHPEILEDLIQVGIPKEAIESLKYYLPKQYQVEGEKQMVGNADQNIQQVPLTVNEEQKGENKNVDNQSEQISKKQWRKNEQNMTQFSVPGDTDEIGNEGVGKKNEEMDKNVQIIKNLSSEINKMNKQKNQSNKR